ncbi:MAG: TRAP transporter substrate-binding protein DctP [Rectinemataceae bacterium]|jgi:TRAP-type C4-dicarboxylate transport system substrate-binding protein
MNIRRTALALFLSVLAAIFGFPARAGAQALTLRIAANAPPNSPWDIGLKRMAFEFDRVSGGRVKIVFPPSAHVESESDSLRRMRLGMDGALISTQGLAELYPDSLALSMPGFISTDEEFDAVLAAVKPLIESKLADRYVVPAVTKGGWVRYFSRSPILYPSDLARLRVSIDQSNDKETRLLQSVGSRLVPGSISDFLLRINTNSVDAICESPIYIATLWFQLRGKISYMTAFKVAPFIGAMVMNKSSWEKIPEELRPPLERVIKEMAERSSLEGLKLEEEAIASLDGIKIPPLPEGAAAKWSAVIEERRDGLIAQMFSPDILEAMDAALAKVRRPM